MSTSVITGKRLEDHLRDAGFSVTSVKNQGPGAAAMRIEAARRIFPGVWFNEETTEAGRDALGLGPEHDWSSHAADAFGLMAVCAEEPGAMRAFNRKFEYPRTGIV
jgi:phage terminase large subunit